MISILMASYNGHRFISEAVRSVCKSLVHAGQDGVLNELVIVDDGSSDLSWMSTMKSVTYEKSVPALDLVAIRYTVNRSQAVALNQGLDKSAGDIVMFLDVDDLWSENKVRLQLEALKEHRWVTGHAQNFRDLGRAEEAAPARLLGTLAIKRDAMEAAGVFRTDLGAGTTIEWFDRAESALKAPPLMLPEVVLLRRIHDENYGVVHRERAKGEYMRALDIIDRRRKPRADPK